MSANGLRIGPGPQVQIGLGILRIDELRIVPRPFRAGRSGHPCWPGLSLAGFRLEVTPPAAWGFPCCV